MLKQKKQKKNSMSQVQHLEDGEILEKSTLSEQLMAVTDYMMSKDLSNLELVKKNQQNIATSTAESQVPLKKKILKDKSTILKKNIQTTKLSKTSQVGSTSNEKDSTKYWLTQCKDLSAKSWLPIETGYVGSHTTTLNGCSTIMEQISSSKINRNIVQKSSLTKICSQLSTFSPHDTMVSEGNIQLKKLQKNQLTKMRKTEGMLHAKYEKKAENNNTKNERVKKEFTLDDVSDKYVISAKRIKAEPLTQYDRRKINDSISAARKVWNCCVNQIQKTPDMTKEELRSMFVEKSNMENPIPKKLDWTFRTAQKIREAVTSRFFANYSTAQKNFAKKRYYYVKSKNKSKKKKKKKKKITMQFKDRKDEKQTISLSPEICKFKICQTTGKTILSFNHDGEQAELVLEEKYDNFDESTKCDTCNYVAASNANLAIHLKRKTKCDRYKCNDCQKIFLHKKDLIEHEQSTCKLTCKNCKLTFEEDTLKDHLTECILPPKTGIPHADIVLQRIGYQYYLYIPEYKAPDIKVEAKGDTVAIDVGWNTLLTYYSPAGEWGEICPGIKDKIIKIRAEIDYINNKRSIRKHRKAKAIRKRKKRIYNMVDDLHWKICHWLLSKYKKIIISRLYVARTNKQGKAIQADLRLCSFVDRLINKSIEYKNSEIHICKEHYTSQACTKCLSLKTVKDKTVKCKDCEFEIHRDLNGARNIFLKHCY